MQEQGLKACVASKYLYSLKVSISALPPKGLKVFVGRAAGW